jgi:RNA polymerase sigma factor (sigma-70 family)
MDRPRAGNNDPQPLKLVPPKPEPVPVELTPHQHAVLHNVELKATEQAGRALIDGPDIKDIVQETMLGMWKKLVANPRLWADGAEGERDGLQIKICGDAIVNLRRAGARMRDREPEEEVDVDNLPSRHASPLDRMIRLEFIVAFAWTLNTLARQARRIWCLKYLDGLRVKEIAIEVGIAPSAVSPSLRKSNLALRDMLRAQGYTRPSESEP